ncbi:MAG TPA: hypothetical protein VGD69_27250 [Herpetosiphonaceae bacterium]
MVSPERIDIQQVLHNLARVNPQGYTFAANLPPWEDVRLTGGATAVRPRTLIGASPELMVSRSGMQIVSNPLAEPSTSALTLALYPTSAVWAIPPSAPGH